MAERLNVVPEELRQAAGEHRHAAECLAAVPSGHAGIMATLESLGPIFAEFREAGRELLDQRRVCYEQQAAAHAELADRLFDAAGRWEQHEAAAARQLRDVGEDGR
ncbi:MAG: ESX-1 secretion-associated protein [Mycobacteriaceae bacterium]